MNAKDYLQRYDDYNRMATRCLDEYHTESAMIKLIRQQPNKHDAELDSAIRYTKSLKAKAEKAIRDRDDILDTLNRMQGLERDVLYARYIDGMKWEDMARKFCYSWHGIFKVHNRAIEILQDILDERENPLQI